MYIYICIYICICIYLNVISWWQQFGNSQALKTGPFITGSRFGMLPSKKPNAVDEMLSESTWKNSLCDPFAIIM